MKKRGSALVISLLLVAAIGGMAVLFGRIVFLEIRNTTITTNGVSAYYAAESGMEEAFLRYRYGKDQQIPIHYSTSKSYVYNISDREVNGHSSTDKRGVLLDNATIFDGLYKQRYALNIGSTTTADLGTGIEQSKDTIAVSLKNQIIEKDNSVRIDLGDYFSSDGSKTLNLKARYLDDNEKLCALLQVKIIGEKANGTTEEKTGIYKAGSGCTYPTSWVGLDGSYNGVFTYDNSPASGNYIATIQPKLKIAPSVQYKNTILVIKNLDSGIEDDSSDDKIVYILDLDGSVAHKALDNTVKSVGYFGGSTRTLEAKINRQYGALYDLFDYVIYSAN